MKIRIAQDKLETILDALAKLGTVQRRNLSAEDVTNQLVDIQARLRNLQQMEASLLQIMKRSGSVGDVPKVAKELSDVRESIEQIDAQLVNLILCVTFDFQDNR
jgi:DNA repair ATPase RecN